ncbi:MAG: hypothetical protein M3O50_01555 [Myxococcota bacterium]|nr:hypothetical protein [Myxococcota bacterium]
MTTSHPASPVESASYRRRIRNYLIDSRFQLKYAGILVAVALVISCVMGTVLYMTTNAVVDESAKVVEESQKIAQESKKVSEVSRMNVLDLAPDNAELVSTFTRECDAHDRAIAEQQRVVGVQQASLMRRQRGMLVSLVGGLMLMVLAIGLFGIYFTHKVAGPVFNMKRLLKQLGGGNLTVDARLRRGDELQDFFEAFRRMVTGLRQFERQQLEQLEVAIDALDHHSSEAAASALVQLRDAMRRSVGS